MRQDGGEISFTIPDEFQFGADCGEDHECDSGVTTADPAVDEDGDERDSGRFSMHKQ